MLQKALPAIPFIGQEKKEKSPKSLHCNNFGVAGEEGFEPSAYGFGDLYPLPLYPLRRNGFETFTSP